LQIKICIRNEKKKKKQKTGWKNLSLDVKLYGLDGNLEGSKN
jgi:hypothetical protein